MGADSEAVYNLCGFKKLRNGSDAISVTVP